MGGEKACVSEALDDYATFDAAFDGILESSKHLYDNSEVIEIDDTSFEGSVPPPKIVDGSSGKERTIGKEMKNVITYDRAKTDVTIANHIGGEFVPMQHVALLTEPLRLEFWSEDEIGDRQADLNVCRKAQTMVSSVVAFAGHEGRFFW